MVRVLHIVDARTSRDGLEQLALLMGETDGVVSVGPGPRADLPAPVTCVHCPMASPHLAALRMRPATEGFDLLHAWSEPARIAGRELALATGRALVASLVCAPPTRDTGRLREAVGPGLLTVTVPTRQARSVLIARGLPGRFVKVLPPAAPTSDDPAGARRRVRDALGLDKTARLAIVPDAMVRGAGHDFACWAHAIVRQVTGNLPLLLPGGGAIERHVRSFASTTGYDDEVFFPGDRWPIDEALAAADLALFFRERDVGVSAVAAAMAAGLPIAGSRTGDLVELVPDDRAAVLVPRRDPRAAAAAVWKLLQHPDLARRLGAEARQRVRDRLTPDAGRRRLAEIYAEAIEGKPF